MADPAAGRRARPTFRTLSLKQRLIVSFTSVLLFVSVGASMMYFLLTRDVLRDNTVRGARVNLGYLMENVDARLRQCQDFSDWILVNRNIERVLIRDYGSGDPSLNYNADIQTAYNLVYDYALRSAVGEYVLSIIIYGYNDVTLRVFEEADGITLSSLVTSAWFFEGMNAGNRIVWPGIRNNISYRIGSTRFILPIVRPVIFADTLKQIGFHAISFHPDLLRDVCRRYGDASSDIVMLVDASGNVVYANRPASSFDTLAAARRAAEAGGNAGNFLSDELGRKSQVCFQHSSRSGMTVYQIMDYRDYDNRGLTAATILSTIVASILVSVLLTVFLSVRLTRPLERIQQRMAGIARGDFTPDPALEGADEIGRLGRGINELATSVDQLLRTNLAEEREKKALEFKLLQNQVNPHFIYNALNSIRMMAMIQKSQGIYDTANALGELLRETSKGSMEKITLREEFYLLEQFIHIHNIRKKGLIRAELALDDRVVDRPVIRFLLQPIVENAILHGFEGKRGICRLSVSAVPEDAGAPASAGGVAAAGAGTIRITVRDDGQGMPPEQAAALLCENPVTEGGRFSRFGVWNVQERIRHVYGEGYGMRVESRPGEGTTVTLVIPLEPPLPEPPAPAAPADGPEDGTAGAPGAAREEGDA